jgi:hypothetical protein
MAIGSSSGGDVAIIVKVDAEGTVSFFDALGQKLQEVETKSAKAGEGFTKAQTKLVSFASAADLAQKAFGLMGRAFDALEHGSNVDDIATSFDNLSNRAGVASDVLLNKLDKAFDGTIAKTDLMKQANELLLGNLDPGKFEVIAQAARKFAEVTGGSAKDGMNALGDSLLRGNDKALKTLGIVVDNTRAIEDYKNKLNIHNRVLSETEQVEAHREANLKALAEQSSKLGTVTTDAGDRVNQLKAAFENEYNQTTQNISNNLILLQTLGDLVAMLGTFTEMVGETINALQGHDQSVNTAATFLKNYVERVWEGYNASEAYTLAITDSAEAVQKMGAQAQTAAPKVNQLGEAFAEQARKRQEQLKKEADAQILQQKGIQAAENLAKANKEIQASIEKLTGSGGFSELARGIAYTFEQLDEGNITAQQAGVALSEMKDQFANTEDGARRFAGALQDGKRIADEWFKDGQEDLKKYNELMAEAGGDSEKFLDKLFGGSKAGGSESLMSVGEVILTGLGAAFSSDAVKDAWAQSIEAALSAAMQIAMSHGLKGNDYKKITDSLAGSIADAFLPGSGPVASALADGIFSVFQSHDSGGTKARKAIDRYFSDLFNADELTVVINNQLSKIKDLDFGGKNFGNAGAGFFDTLQSQAAPVQQAFQGVADAVTQMLGQSAEYGTNLAAVLANNLGGSLNNLQLLVQATGKSFEDLGNAIIQSMMAGEISVQEAAAGLQQLQNLMQKGIPGAIGAVDQAWKNMQAAGEKGGRALLDSVGDVAAEAAELGIKTLPQLEQALINTFHVPQGEAQKFFEALSIAGVRSFDDLLHASNATLIAIAANYEDLIKGLNAGFASANSADETTPNFSTPVIPAASHISSTGSSSSTKAADTAKENAKKQREAIDQLLQSSADYTTILKAMTKGTVSEAEANMELLAMRNQAIVLLKAQTAAHKALDEAERKHKTNLEDYLGAVAKADKAVTDFQAGAEGLKEGVNDGSFLLPAEFKVSVDAGGLDIRGVADLASHLVALPLTKTFTLKLNVVGSAKDKDIISRAASSFGSDVGPGQGTR